MPNFFGPNVNELQNAHIGPALLFYAPYGTTFPTAIADVVNMSGANQWQPKTGWSCLGATKSGIKVERGFTKIDRSSDQSNGPFDSRANNWTAGVNTELLESTLTALQLAWEGGVISNDSAGAHTTLSATAAAGAGTFSVASAASLASGQVLSVGIGPYQEWHTIVAVSGTTITLAAGETFAYAQASGSFVMLPGAQSIGFGRPRSTTPRVLSVIAPLEAVSTTAKGNIYTLRMWAFRYTRLTDGQKTMTLQQENDWTTPIGFMAYRDPAITDETQDIMKVFDLTLA